MLEGARQTSSVSSLASTVSCVGDLKGLISDYRAVLTSKSDPIGVWLVSATHQQPGDPGSASHPGISLEQPASQSSMHHPSGSLKVEQHDYGLPGENPQRRLLMYH